jgi:hypothetical protein
LAVAGFLVYVVSLVHNSHVNLSTQLVSVGDGVMAMQETVVDARRRRTAVPRTDAFGNDIPGPDAVQDDNYDDDYDEDEDDENEDDSEEEEEEEEEESGDDEEDSDQSQDEGDSEDDSDDAQDEPVTATKRKVILIG